MRNGNTTNAQWIQRAMSVIAYYAPDIARRIHLAPETLTVINGPEEMLDLINEVGLANAFVMAEDMDIAFGMTIRPDDEHPDVPLQGNIWLSKPNIERQALEMGVPVELFAADVLVHEFKHHDGYGEPEAYDAGTAFARTMGVPQLIQLSEEGKRQIPLQAARQAARENAYWIWRV